MHASTPAPHIVIIEHSPPIRGLLQELFREERYRSTILDGCPASAGEVARLRPDVIIHDYVPTRAEADIASLRRLSSDPSTCRVPLILCSAALDAQDVAHRLGIACASVVGKPFVLEDLLRAIETARRSGTHASALELPQEGSGATA